MSNIIINGTVIDICPQQIQELQHYAKSIGLNFEEVVLSFSTQSST